MNREEFMKRLECLLADIPENDRLDAVSYYNDYFDEAGAENEARVIRELGSPEKVAATIKADLNVSGNESEEYTGYKYECKDLSVKTKQKRNIPILLIIILLIFASPVLIGIAGGLLGGIIGVLVGVFGILIAVFACAIAFFVAGVFLFVIGFVRVIPNPMEGLVTIGIGSVFLVLGILFLLFSIWTIFKWIPALVRGIVKLCQRIFHKGERGNKA